MCEVCVDAEERRRCELRATCCGAALAVFFANPDAVYAVYAVHAALFALSWRLFFE